MTTSYTTRNKPITPYYGRGSIQSNIYNLTGLVGGIVSNIQDINGNQIVVLGPAYNSTTPYSIRIKP